MLGRWDSEVNGLGQGAAVSATVEHRQARDKALLQFLGVHPESSANRQLSVTQHRQRCRRKAIHLTGFANPSALCLKILLRRNGGVGG
jgi:hypothetical protein